MTLADYIADQEGRAKREQIARQYTCPDCNGSGKLHHTRGTQMCLRCRSTGVVVRGSLDLNTEGNG